ncbi:26S proteasome regulatory subunit N1 [Nematocida displodere]|uniref:26S proteasome regulatory subunit N1 n=1 Tax=Nematocida displodere TaxID=1805483 RepID=A0A177EK87_9MICR|nr:26S proteasome regulatory subunit N1 [Nematocida displodere]
MDKTEDIRLILDNLNNRDPGIAHSALSMLVQKLRSSTSVASTIPKILIHLISQKDVLKERLATLTGENRKMMADVLSVISATHEDTDSLRYRIEGGSTPLDLWGHQYVKKLSSDIIRVYVKGPENAKDSASEHPALNQALNSTSTSTSAGIGPEDIQAILGEVLACLFKFNSECDGIDLLIETGGLRQLLGFTDQDNLDRVCTYLLSIIPYLQPQQKKEATRALISIYRKFELVIEYTNLLVKESKEDEVRKIFLEEPLAVQVQMAYILARDLRYADLDTEHQNVRDILENRHMAGMNAYAAEKLELTTAASDRDRGTGAFPEALSKASFFNESISVLENKKSYKISSLSAKGILHLWNPESAMAEFGEHLFSDDGYVKASSILGLATSSCRVHDENETVLALVRENLGTNSTTQKLVLLQALAMQYTGTQREDIYQLVRPHMSDLQPEVSYFSIYVIGSIFAKSYNVEVFTEVVQVLMEKTTTSSFMRFALLGLGLIFLEGKEKIDGVMELAESIDGIGKSLSILLRGMGYFGSGNTAILHAILKDALEELTPSNSSDDEEAEEPQQEYKHVFAIIGVALISVGDETLVQMATHILEGAMLLDIPRVQMAVPFALAILHMSTAKVEVIETLKRCTNSEDLSVVVSAVVSLGVIAAGSNNSRVLNALESLGDFCHKGAPGSALKIAQGLLHLGKGMMKLSLFSGSAASAKSVAGITGFLFSLMDVGMHVLDRHYFVLMLLAQGIAPKYLLTVDDTGAPVKKTVRVGTWVDVSGAVGRPKRIAGAQVHETPVVVQSTEAVEVLGRKGTYTSADTLIVVQQSSTTNIDE